MPESPAENSRTPKDIVAPALLCSYLERSVVTSCPDPSRACPWCPPSCVVPSPGVSLSLGALCLSFRFSFLTACALRSPSRPGLLVILSTGCIEFSASCQSSRIRWDHFHALGNGPVRPLGGRFLRLQSLCENVGDCRRFSSQKAVQSGAQSEHLSSLSTLRLL